MDSDFGAEQCTVFESIFTIDRLALTRICAYTSVTPIPYIFLVLSCQVHSPLFLFGYTAEQETHCEAHLSHCDSDIEGSAGLVVLSEDA